MSLIAGESLTVESDALVLDLFKKIEALSKPNKAAVLPAAASADEPLGGGEEPASVVPAIQIEGDCDGDEDEEPFSVDEVGLPAVPTSAGLKHVVSPSEFNVLPENFERAQAVVERELKAVVSTEVAGVDVADVGKLYALVVSGGQFSLPNFDCKVSIDWFSSV